MWTFTIEHIQRTRRAGENAHDRQGRHGISARRGTWEPNGENPDMRNTHMHIYRDTRRGAQMTKTLGNLIKK